ncbi:MAG: Uma2 family endonuclease [bacterium]|nr:Uma2 family endonuclease [bacterium]
MIDEESIFEHLLRSPRLVAYFGKIKHTLEKEQKKRQQFYDMITADRKAEFINGEIIMQSPVKLKHSLVGQRLFILLHEYVAIRDLGFVGYEKLMISLTRNDYEPDICFFCKEKAEQFEPDQWQFPAPDSIVEVLSESTEKKDRGDKFVDYAAHGVTEYWIIDPTEETIEQYQLQGNRYKLLRKVDAGKLKSMAVNGFEIPVRALFDEEEKKKTLQKIIAST